MMSPWRKIALPMGPHDPIALCTLVYRMMMFLLACHWCLGGFTPDKVWGAETPALSSPNNGSSTEEYSFFRPSPEWSTRFFPTPQEIQRYRKSWNPFSHGPILAN